jgi:ABC-type lipoprotein export system ATPase subunit
MKSRTISACDEGPVALLDNVHITGEGNAPILRGISMAVERGERVLITGPNGSGKSTIIRSLGGMVMPQVGSVRIFGRDLAALSARQRSKLIAQRVGIGFQAHNLQEGRTSLENTTTMWDVTRRGSPPLERLASIAVALGLTSDMLLHSSHVLSGGQKHRVALARLLFSEPELLMFDEPTAALDPHGDFGKQAVYRVIDEAAERTGATVIMVSHDEEAASIASREIVLHGGLIVSSSFNPSCRAA